MLRQAIVFAVCALGWLIPADEAKAQYRCNGAYYTGYRPYAAPYYVGGYYGARPFYGYGAYPGYGYRPYYAYPRPAYVYPAPVYYGPRVGVTYVNPPIGIAIGF